MSMTKKHYEGLAAALKSSGASGDVVAAVAKFCERDNMAFKPARFKEAATDNTPTAKKARELARQVVAVWIGDGNLCDEVASIAEDSEELAGLTASERQRVEDMAADVLRDFSNQEDA